jgi:hypothetical protein
LRLRAEGTSRSEEDHDRADGNEQPSHKPLSFPPETT